MSFWFMFKFWCYRLGCRIYWHWVSSIEDIRLMQKIAPCVSGVHRAGQTQRLCPLFMHTFTTKLAHIFVSCIFFFPFFLACLPLLKQIMLLQCIITFETKWHLLEKKKHLWKSQDIKTNINMQPVYDNPCWIKPYERANKVN